FALGCAAAWLALAVACGVKAPPRPPLPQDVAPATLDGGAADGGAGPAEPAWPDAGLPRTTP
ncbi:MAG TPA: hypothetical protein VIV59_12600, partial [Anaeromyxobacteraceae bacterium]